jgi:hypothetical protein
MNSLMRSRMVAGVTLSALALVVVRGTAEAG